MYRIKCSYVVGILMFLILAGCQNQVEHTAPRHPSARLGGDDDVVWCKYIG